MGKRDTQSKSPPVADYRKNTGRHHVKLGKVERDQTHERAIARKQEFPVRKMVLLFISFCAACGLLFMYLQYVLADDDEEDAAS